MWPARPGLLVAHFGRAYGRWLHEAATGATTGRW
jgi:hypothetical protein